MVPGEHRADRLEFEALHISAAAGPGGDRTIDGFVLPILMALVAVDRGVLDPIPLEPSMAARD